MLQGHYDVAQRQRRLGETRIGAALKVSIIDLYRDRPRLSIGIFCGRVTSKCKLGVGHTEQRSRLISPRFNDDSDFHSRCRKLQSLCTVTSPKRECGK